MIQPNSLAQYKVYIRDNNHPNPKPNHFLLPTPSKRALRRPAPCVARRADAPPRPLPRSSPCARPLPGGLAGRSSLSLIPIGCSSIPLAPSPLAVCSSSPQCRNRRSVPHSAKLVGWRCSRGGSPFGAAVQGTSLQGTIDELMCLLLVYIICQLLTWMELVCASFWLL